MVKKIFVILLLIAVVGIGAFFFFNSSKKTFTNNNQNIQNDNLNTNTNNNGNETNGSSNHNSLSENILKNVYNGFPKLKKGNWSEWVTYFDNGKSGHQLAIYLGEKNLNGQNVYGVEVDSEMEDGTHPVIVVWFKKKTTEVAKIISKGFNGSSKVFCLTKSQVESLMPDFASQIPSPSTPDKYKPNKPDISYGTYTTPTGKTVKVGKIKTNNEIAWVSSEVPFGIVKMITLEGKKEKVEGYLYDFGNSGKTPKISEDDEKNCLSLPF